MPSPCKESFVGHKIIESWLEWKGPSQIGQEMKLSKKPLPKLLIFSFAGGISKTTNEDISLGQRVLNDVNNYMECCKTTCTTPAIQNKLVKNNVPMFARNVPSPACSRSVTQDLGLYSFKKFSVIPQESLTLENKNILYHYLAACADNAFL